MVIILQQTMDNGKRFVSTVVEEDSFNSNFSSSSRHNSISERSAIYKQRIDSLFGRHTRLNPFKPTLEPFINLSEVRNHENVSGENAPSSAQLHHPKPLLMTGLKPATTAISCSSQNILCKGSPTNTAVSSEDENYETIDEKTCSIVTDSLTHCSKKQHRDRDSTESSSSGKKCSSFNSVSHVSSVRLNCEDTDRSSRTSNPIIGTSMDREIGNKTVGESHMWRNGTYGDSPCNEERQYGIVRTSPGGVLKFAVEYLGSIPVDGTTTSLKDLQAPLRNLYINFLSGNNIMSGQLSITSDGLRFEAPKLRLVNPFATIAVWAAIKFVAHGEPTPNECAFMPLISDPEGQDKSRLFGRMNPDLSRAYMACMSSQRAFRNPPIFACVMREASFSLDCHAFACKCAEDAIVIAANLYQSLVDKMRSNKEGESGYGSLTRNSPVNQSQSSPNENRSCSSASSQGSPRLTSGNSSSSGVGCESSGHSEGINRQDVKALPKQEHRVVFSDSESVIPVRPPRRKKKGSNGIPSNLKRYNSDDSVLMKPHRRKSFKGNCNQQYTKPKKRVQIATPEETTSSESINESIDQVLDRIINPGGMSFNDLKPSYQELILKIALTLTQDQLYQKSKQAMKKHQQFNLRKKGNKTQDVPDDNSQFLNLMLKSFSKITSGKASSNSTKRKNGKFAVNPKLKSKQIPPKVILKKPKDEDPFTSFCSGCVCENCSDKCYCSLPSKHNVKIVGLPPVAATASSSGAPGENVCDDHCQESCSKNPGSSRKKMCGYDTDSCAESEKCYCSLQRVKSNGLKIYNINLDTETSDTDTNSYDFEPFNTSREDPPSVNLKTIAGRSVEILSYHPAKRLMYNLNSTSNLHTTNALVHFDDSKSPGTTSHMNCNGNINGANRNHSAASSSCSHSDDILSDSSNGHQRQKVLLITGSNPSTRVMYKEQYHESRKSQRSNLVDITEDDSTEECRPFTHRRRSSNEEGMAPEKILSMKKTAEIAAMFTDLHLDQTTNLVAPTNKRDTYKDTNTTDDTNALDFEASLGYLP